jgi:hypothetical protein
MSTAKWVTFAAALGMMAATAGWLQEFKGRHLLGPAGVRVEQVPIYGESNNLVSAQSIVLPNYVMGIPSQPLPITFSEVNGLPKDTTFGRRFYRTPGSDFGVQVSVVLMGTDHTSIHQPQYCLYGQDWTITNTERVQLRMDRPYAYNIPAMKLTATRQLKDGQLVDCLYVYWFVSGTHITDEEGSRLWSMWKTILQKGELERWAYISYFVACVPGTEQATFERLTRFIRASAPDFQLVAGPPAARLPALVSEK